VRFLSLQRLRYQESVFPGLPSLALSAHRLSLPFSVLFLLSLSGFFHPVALLGFPFRAFSSKRSEAPLGAPCPLVVGCFALRCLRVPRLLPGCERRVYSSTSGSSTLLELVHTRSGISLSCGRCSPGFSSSSGVFLLCLALSPLRSIAGVVPLPRRRLS
jgi:hypothetical protein